MDGDFKNVTPLDASKASRAMQLRAALTGLDSIKPNLMSNYLVKGWLDHGAFSVVFGESNVGKSFFALDLAMHVAAGSKWHGSRIKSGTVVYIASEGGTGFLNRIAALQMEHPDLTSAASGNFFILPITVDLCGSNDVPEIVALIKGITGNPALVIVDTLARSMGNGDENSAPDMASFIRNIDAIRDRTGAHVMAIHHTGKDVSRGARGHSSLRGAVDTEITLTKEDSVIQAEAVKQRDMSTGSVFSYQLHEVELGRDQDGDAVTTCVVEQCEAPKKTVKLSGQANTAMQAFGDALLDHGKVKTGGLFPDNRQCVEVTVWQDYCYRHDLSNGNSESARRKAFSTVKKSLQNKGIIRIVDDFVWRCDDA